MDFSSQWWWLFAIATGLVLFIMLIQICSKLNRVHRLLRMLAVKHDPELAKMLSIRF